MKSTQSGRDFVHFSLAIGALELLPEGRKLKSGRISPYFFNSGLFNNGKSLLALATAYVEALARVGFPDAVFGPAYKGISLATTIATTAYARHDVNIGCAYNRKEVKDHGEGGLLMGADLRGKTITIVDDVMTTGSSIIEAVSIVQTAGGTVRDVVIGFDRQEKGLDTDLSAVQAFTAAHNLPVTASACLADLIAVIEMHDRRHPILEKILEYKDAYGAAV